MLGVNSVVTVVCKQLHQQRSGGSAAIAESHKVPCPLVTLKGSLAIAQSWKPGHYSSGLDMYLKCGRNIFNTITCTLLHGQLERVETCTTHSNNIIQVNQPI